MKLLLLLALSDLSLLGAAGAGPVKVAAKTPWKEKEEIQKKGRQSPSSEKQKRQQTTSGADATIPKLRALFEWLHHSGGFIDQRLSFQKTSGRGRGIVATAAIPKDELTIWLPKTQMILARDDLKLAEGTFKELMQNHQAAWASYPCVEEHVEPVARVAANLALEAQRGGESRFHPYIASLPSSCPANLLTASPGLRRWMQDTPARWIPSFQNISLQVLNMLLDGRGVSKALQKWSLCMVLSRTAQVDRLEQQVQELNQRDARREQEVHELNQRVHALNQQVDELKELVQQLKFQLTSQSSSQTRQEF